MASKEERTIIEDYKDIRNLKINDVIELRNGIRVSVYREPHRFGEGWKVACASKNNSGWLCILALYGAKVIINDGGDRQ